MALAMPTLHYGSPTTLVELATLRVEMTACGSGLSRGPRPSSQGPGPAAQFQAPPDGFVAFQPITGLVDGMSRQMTTTAPRVLYR